MSCCIKIDNQKLYAAETPSGYAVCCIKCGRAKVASREDVERISAKDADQ